ncbi:MAG TPA: hypothetical protein VMV10_01075 [Pirellulales bacterium]|nr:hypothetical protein [Pirellulales bacterium]
MKSNTLEVAFDLPHDGNLFFVPAGMSLRGRRDFMRMAAHQPSAVMLHTEFPRGIPSTLLRLDLDEKTATLVEPLRTDEWIPEAEKFRAKGIDIPQHIEFKHVHLGDWLHEVKRAIDAGYAQIVKGELPRDLGEESRKAAPTSEQKSQDRIEKLCDLVEQLVSGLAGVMKAAGGK